MNVRIRFFLVTIAAVLGVVITASLGQWQLNRAKQKTAALAELQAQSTKSTLNALELAAHNNPTQLIHRSARLRGRWIPDRTIFLDNRQMGGRVGFLVVTPFILENSSAVVIVQRGWAPRAFDDRSRIPEIDTPTESVEILGRIAPPPPKLYELKESGSGAIRQNLDLFQFSSELSSVLLPVTLQQTGVKSEGVSREWPAPNLGLDKHHGYAFQWFGLATLISVLYFWFQIVRRLLYRSKDPVSHV